VGVKVAQFSFSRLRGADPVLRVEMSSTGEVACFGRSKHEAFLKAFLSTGSRLPQKNSNIFLSIGSFKEKMEFLPFIKKLSDLGFTLFASHGTADFISAHDIPVKNVDNPTDATSPSTTRNNNASSSSSEEDVQNNIEEHLTDNHIQLCIVCPSNRGYQRASTFVSRGYLVRRKALESNMPLITNIQYAKLLVDSMLLFHNKEIPISVVDTRSSRRVVTLPGKHPCT
jgi:carbamoyl-phosphate synthase/aspartate carbamoyltransferase